MKKRLGFLMLSAIIVASTMAFTFIGGEKVADKSTLEANASMPQHDMPQSVNEVIKWKTSVQQNGCEATLIVEVTQLDEWHIYSQILPKDAINQPTEFHWEAEVHLK